MRRSPPWRTSWSTRVMDVAGPVEEFDAPTLAMFRRFQAALLTLAKEWRDLDLGQHEAPLPIESAIAGTA